MLLWQETGLDTVDANRALGLPDDCREYTSVTNILADLGIRSIKLMVRSCVLLCLCLVCLRVICGFQMLSELHAYCIQGCIHALGAYLIWCLCFPECAWVNLCSAADEQPTQDRAFESDGCKGYRQNTLHS